MRIKFCGITRPDDAEAAVSAGAWAIGLVFAPRSPRRVSVPVAAELAAGLRRRVEVAGVFVDPTLDRVAEVAEAVGLTLVQLHGSEGPAFCAEVARRTGAKVIKAARVRSHAEIQALRQFHTDFHLLDSYVPGVAGGSGVAFAWELARRPPSRKIPVILSGGLTPANVADALEIVRPWAVDVSSGVESAPGVKDPEKIAQFSESVSGWAAARARTRTAP